MASRNERLAESEWCTTEHMTPKNRFGSISGSVCLFLAFGCATTTPVQQSASATTPAAAYGTTRETAVEVCKPTGERKYLQRLRCSDGSVPTFTREGSGGSRTALRSDEDEKKVMDQMFRQEPLAPGEADYHVIDFYEVKCGAQATTVVLDMYHCHQAEPAQAPPGFTIEPPL